jgi:hypothetical protein
LGEQQNPAAVAEILRKPGPFHTKIANFHLLLFLAHDTHFDLQVCGRMCIRWWVDDS